MFPLSNKHDLLFRYPLCTKILFILSQNKQETTEETFEVRIRTQKSVVAAK